MDLKKKSIVRWALMIILVIAIGSTMGAMFYIYSSINHFDQVFAKGISIQNIPLEGLTREEASQKLIESLGKTIEKEKITLLKDDKTCNVPLKELEVSYDFDKILEEALKKGHEGNFFEKYTIATKGLKEDINFNLKYSYDKGKIEEGLKTYKDTFTIAALDAAIERKDKQFIITPEQAGEEMNTAETAEVIAKHLDNNTLEEPVRIVTKVLKPIHTVEALKNIQTPVSSFSTSYNDADRYRNINLKVAAKKINEVLAPGETFSLGKHLEPVTYEAGYRASKVIVNGKIENGIGGGVCQIASTLYNAVLLSNLDITVRQNHSLPVAYVPLGRDATYSTDSIDFRFKNNSKYPVFIESYCESNKVYVNIFGHESVKPTYDEIKFQSDTIETITPPATKYIKDPALPEGKEIQETSALYGKKVKLYKLYYSNGKLVNKEYIDQSYYKPRAAVIKVGTKPAQVAPTLQVVNTAPHANTPDENTEVIDFNNYTLSEEELETDTPLLEN